MDRQAEPAKLRIFQKDEVVPVRNYAPGRKWFPALIPAKTGPLSYTVATRDELVWCRHADKLLAAPYQGAETSDGEMEMVQAEPAEVPNEGSMGPIATPLSDEPGATVIVMDEVHLEESPMADSPEPRSLERDQRGGTVARWLALLPHSGKDPGSIPGRVTVCVEFAHSPRVCGVSSGCSGFLPQSKRCASWVN